MSTVEIIKDQIEYAIRLLQILISDKAKSFDTADTESEYKAMVIGLLLRLHVKFDKTKTELPYSKAMIKHILEKDPDLIQIKEMPLKSINMILIELQRFAEDIGYTKEEEKTYDSSEAFKDSVSEIEI